MGLDFNPNFPQQIGNERRDAGYTLGSVSSATSWQALQFRAKHSGPTSNIEVFGSTGTSAPKLGTPYFEQPSPLALDLYPVSGAPYITPYPVFLSTHLASAVTGSASMLNENFSTPITVSRIQASDGSFIVAAALNAFVRVQFDTATFALDRRILAVRMLVRVSAKTEIQRVDADGTSPWIHTQSISSGGYTNYTPNFGEAVMLDADQPDWGWWTPQMIRNFRSGGPSHWFFRCKGFGWQCDNIRLEVIWTPETRIGVGMNPPNDPLTWTSFSMKTPAGTGTPSLVAGQDYVAVVRRPYNDSIHSVSRANLTWRKLNGSPLVTGWGSVNGIVSSVPVTGSTFGNPTMYKYVKKNPVVFTHDTLCTQMVTGGPSESGGLVVETSMPYILSRGALVHTDAPPATGHSVAQSIVVSGAATSVVYGQTAAIVGWESNAPPSANAKIRSEVWTVTGGPESRVFSPVERSFLEVFRMPIVAEFPVGESNVQTRFVRFRHPESRTLPAGTYRIILSTPDNPESTRWRVESLISTAHTTDQTQARTLGNATGFWPSGSIEHPLTGADSDGAWSSDAQVVLMAVPPAVTGTVGSVGVTTAHHAEVCAGETCGSQGCSDEGSPFTYLTWSQGSDPTTAYYEIQRSDEFDTTFRTVAFVRGIVNTEWRDHEVRIGVKSFYRIRSVRADDIAGEWSEDITVSMPVSQIGLTFTSNAATGLAVTYYESWDGNTVNREFTFQEYDDVRFAAIYGRERQVAFHPLERKGVTFSRSLLINALCSVTPPTMRLFNPLRVISWAPIPYVCVRDGEGNRWFANVLVPEGSNIRPGERWYAEVVITEVSFTPAIHDGDVPQIEADILAAL